MPISHDDLIALGAFPWTAHDGKVSIHFYASTWHKLVGLILERHRSGRIFAAYLDNHPLDPDLATRLISLSVFWREGNIHVLGPHRQLWHQLKLDKRMQQALGSHSTPRQRVSISEAARIKGVSSVTIRNWINAQKIFAARNGKGKWDVIT